MIHNLRLALELIDSRVSFGANKQKTLVTSRNFVSSVFLIHVLFSIQIYDNQL